MALITTIEINHDKSDVFRNDPKFGENLYLALAHRYPDKLNERILRNYGIITPIYLKNMRMASILLSLE